MSATATEVGGPILDRAGRILLLLAGIGAAIVAWRFWVGLGPATGLNDGYPWGIWIALDVVTGTALACGGYAVALLAYILNKGQYHPLVRPAILTSALGYTFAGAAIAIDVGRPWFMYRIPVQFWDWNLDSALLEVALCVMAYVLVLWIELSPALMEGYEGRSGRLAELAARWRPRVERVLLFVIALGILLPTMHQSSLGTVMMLTGAKLDVLWQTPLLPLLFLISCIAMGYGIVVVESLWSSAAFKRTSEVPMLRSLAGAGALIAGVYVVLRVVDVAVRGRMPELFAFDAHSVFTLVELALFAVPVGLYLAGRVRGPGQLLRFALLLLIGGTLYRIDAYLVGFDPGPGWSYFPTIPEMLVTVGVVAGEILAYIAIVKRFPILAGGTSHLTNRRVS